MQLAQEGPEDENITLFRVDVLLGTDSPYIASLQTSVDLLARVITAAGWLDPSNGTDVLSLS